MLRRIIDWSTRNRFLVGLAVIFIAGAGLWAVKTIPLEALPDLTDVQVIVQTDFAEQAPQIVEDQVTYPITTQMLKVPGAKTVRGYSFFGMSLVYVIFEDGTDLYWARSRVLEYLNGLRGRLPAAADPTLGPDATGLGWVYEYVLTSDRHSLYELRAIQDWYLRYVLTSVPGVSEVASVGGFEKQYQVEVDPVRLQAFGIPITRVMDAVQGSNAETGARVLEVAGREYMIRVLGYARGLGDIENAVVGATSSGTPVRVRDVANVQLGPEIRRGAADWNGRGEAVGGIVVMRFGENALTTIQRVKARLAEVQRGLPEGVRVVPVYDRSDLIERAISTLREKLTEESVVVAAVCVVFLLHLRSAFVAILTLPLGVLMSLLVMRWMGLSADIMSLGGIAIAIGAMVDAAVVMIENLHKHLERAGGSEAVKGERRWEIVREAAGEVGPALFFSLLVITVSFLPVFTLEAQEGRLFKPLAYTKTFAMAASALLAITVVPVAMGYLIRGRIRPEQANPVNRWLLWLYRPVLLLVLRHPWKTVAVCAVVLAATVVPASRLGSEFMPPLDEGTLLYMPTTIPGASITAARRVMQVQDSILAGFPEVASVFGKVGRANTATDPAQLDMIETTIVLKPQREWRPGMTREQLVAEMDEAVRTIGYANAWTQPIRGRIDMLATGIRTPVGIKIFGPDLGELERIGRQIEAAVGMVPGTRSVFAERAVSGSYLDIEVNREQAARYGLNVLDVQRTIAAAIGGMEVTTTVEGRQRFSVNVRYPRDLRGSPDALRRVLIPVSLGSVGGGPGDVWAGAAVGGGAAAAASTMGGGARRDGRRRGPHGADPTGADRRGAARQRADAGQDRGRLPHRVGAGGHDGPRPGQLRARREGGRGLGRHAAARLHPEVERPVRIHGAREAEAQGGRATHPAHHRRAALPQLRERARPLDRLAVAAVRAGGRDLVPLGPRLQLQRRRGRRLYRAVRRRGRGGSGDADLPRLGVRAPSQGRCRDPGATARGDHGGRGGAPAAQDDDGDGDHGGTAAHHVGERRRRDGDAPHRSADDRRHGEFHCADAAGDSGDLPVVAARGTAAGCLGFHHRAGAAGAHHLKEELCQRTG